MPIRDSNHLSERRAASYEPHPGQRAHWRPRCVRGSNATWVSQCTRDGFGWAVCLGTKVKRPSRLSKFCFDKRLQWAGSCFQYVASATYLAFPNPSASGSRARQARLGFEELKFDVSQISVNRGQVALVKFLKDLAANCRRVALEDISGGALQVRKIRKYFRGLWNPKAYSEEEGRRMLIQFSSFIRALPEPPDAIATSALKKHREVLTSELRVHHSKVSSFRAWVSNWCKNQLPNRAVVSGTLSFSASAQTTRSHGGALAELRLIADEYRAELLSDLSIDPLADIRKDTGPPRLGQQSRENLLIHHGASVPRDQIEYLYDKPWCENHGVDLETWEALREHLFLRDACLALVAPILRGERLPGCRQTVVRTRGCKARVVTSIEAPFVYLCHLWRQVLAAGLRSWPPTSGSLAGSLREPVNEFLAECDISPDLLVRSVDMSEATDRLPLNLLRGGVEAISDHFGLNQNDWKSRLLFSSVGRYDMKCQNGDMVVTVRGILMGLPTSWSLLCLYNGWLLDQAAIKAGLSQRRDRERQPLPGPFKICGDDLVVYTSKSCSRYYTENLESTGGLISVGKDYESKRSGLFREVAFTLGSALSVVASVKGLTAEGDLDSPSWLIVGPACTQAIEGIDPVRNHRVRAFICARHRRVIERLRRAGLYPFVPRDLYGGGFPRALGDNRIPKRLSRTLRVLMAGLKPDIDLLRSLWGLEGVWSTGALSSSTRYHSMISGDVWTHIENICREGIGLFDYRVAPRGSSFTVLDRVNQEINSLLGSYLLALGPPPVKKSRFAPSIKDVAKRLFTAIDEINRLIPSKRLAGQSANIVKGWRRFKDRLEALSLHWTPSQLATVEIGPDEPELGHYVPFWVRNDNQLTLKSTLT